METLPTDAELKLLEEPAELLTDSEKTEQREEVEGKKDKEEEKDGETTHEEFSLE